MWFRKEKSYSAIKANSTESYIKNMTLKNKCIIFGNEHHNSLGQVRSLGEHGIRPIVVMLKSKVKITSASKYVSEKYFVSSIDEGYKFILKKWGNLSDKPFIFTSDDLITSYLDMKYDEIKDKFYFNNCGKQGAITMYMDKMKMYKIAESIGFLVPSYTRYEDLDLKDLDYPIITKTKTSLHENWKDDSFVCFNKNDLTNALSKIKCKDIMIQKYIDKENELCLEGFSYCDGKKNFISVGLSMKYFVKGAYAHYLDIFNFNDEQLLAKVNNLMETFKYNGVFEIEFLKDRDGSLYFLEVNFRNSAWGYVTNKVNMSTAIGWIHSQLDVDYKPVEYNIKKGFTAMSEFADFKIRVMHKMIKYKEWKKQYKTCNCLYYYDKNDKKPFINAFIYKLFKTIF